MKTQLFVTILISLITVPVIAKDISNSSAFQYWSQYEKAKLSDSGTKTPAYTRQIIEPVTDQPKSIITYQQQIKPVVQIPNSIQKQASSVQKNNTEYVAPKQQKTDIAWTPPKNNKTVSDIQVIQTNSNSVEVLAFLPDDSNLNQQEQEPQQLITPDVNAVLPINNNWNPPKRKQVADILRPVLNGDLQ